MTKEQTPSFKDAAAILRQELSKIYPQGEADAITEMIAAAVSGLSRTERICNPKLKLSDRQWQCWQQYKKELLAHRPVQYVLGQTYFSGLSLYVNESVLIPRPETEELIALTINEIKSSFAPGRLLNILDIGTGSGCIALAIKKELPESTVYAADISIEALQIAKKNAKKNQLGIHFLHWNILEEMPPDILPKIDIIISNPPYITPLEKTTLDKHVLDYEPQEALFVTNADPLQFYKKIETISRRILNPDGKMFFELHENFATQTADYFLQKAWRAELENDFYGKQRMLALSKEQ